MHIEPRLIIKGMVCSRCILVIKSELEDIGVKNFEVTLGEVTMIDSECLPPRHVVADRLQSLGFELLEDPKIKIVNEVKRVVSEVCSGEYDFPEDFRLSDVLVSVVNRDYNTISSTFSLIERKTIETYFIEYRVEKVKEMLVYQSLSLADIAFRLNFSSVAHLSRQFKQYTGLTTSHFKEIGEERSRTGPGGTN